jgi:hypothetical protein
MDQCRSTALIRVSSNGGSAITSDEYALSRMQFGSIEHPNAPNMATRLAPLFSDHRAKFIDRADFRIRADIQTPDGMRKLG